MRKITWILLLAGLIPGVAAKAGLRMEIAGRAGSGETGWTEVANGNSKGQTLIFKDKVSLSGITLQVAKVSDVKDLSVEIWETMKGVPAGAALFADSGTLPAELKQDDLLEISFATPVELPAGKYAIILKTEASRLRFGLCKYDAYADGELIRRKGAGKWKPGIGKKTDLIFTLRGSGVEEIVAIPTAGSAESAKSGSAGKKKSKKKKRVTTLSVPAGAVKVNRSVSRNVKPLCDQLPLRPNIIQVMADDLGWNHISVMQSTMGTAKKKYATPNLELLANKGLSFTHAYAQPNCAPSRAAMLTGQYPARVNNDVYCVGSLRRQGKKDKTRFLGAEQSEDVAPEAITVAEALKRNGYATAHIGKYHVGGHEGGEKTLPENAGFDINIGGCSQGHQSTCFASLDKASGKWVFKKLGRGDFDRFAAPYTKEYVEKYGFPASLIGKPKHVSDAVGDAMEETIAKLHATGKPFYLQLHTYAVHGPVKARPDLKEKAGGDNFAGFIAGLDINIGRLLKAIDDPNGDGNTNDSIAARTLVLFTSDNGGTHDNNLPLRGEKGMFTEGGIRVPLIAYWPSVIPPNTVTDHIVHSVDYYPTYLELAGKKWVPPESVHPLDGESFAEILRKPDIDRKRGPVFYLFPGYLDIRAKPCAVTIDEINGKYFKLFYFYESNSWELYNLTDDISESENLINQRAELARVLSKRIHTWLIQKHPTWKPKYPLEKESGKPVGPPPEF